MLVNGSNSALYCDVISLDIVLLLYLWGIGFITRSERCYLDRLIFSFRVPVSLDMVCGGREHHRLLALYVSLLAVSDTLLENLKVTVNIYSSYCYCIGCG